MGVCNESGRKKNISDKSNINKIKTQNSKTISSSNTVQDTKVNKSLNHKGLISKYIIIFLFF